MRWLVLLLLGLAAVPAAAVPAWQVSADGAPGTVVLLGSVHMLRPGQLPLPDAIEAAYAAADRLLMELHPDELAPASAAAALQRIGFDAPGRRSRELLDEPSWARAKAGARAAGVDPAALANLEPWFAAISLYTGALAAAGYDPALGVDQQLGERALRDGRPIAALETLAEQLGMFRTLDAATQAELLLKTLEEIQTAPADTDLLVAEWRAGDVASLARRLQEDFSGYPELRERIVEQRNHRWSPRVAALLEQEGASLVVVGALHLVGPEGLPALLEARGLRVERMR